jgi:hypothetical protein
MAYKLWIKQRVQMCITMNNDESSGTLVANEDRLPDAEALVDAKILTIMPSDQMIGDTPEIYEARKRVEFMMSGNINWVTLDPDIVVPQLPSNAPPNAVIANQELTEFRNNLIFELTFHQWLCDETTDLCMDSEMNFNDLHQMILDMTMAA